ncbi:hypothetical protein RRG08_041542 [Elysia crispata]|uniref:Uncharacterized protein n=1 Tax=Elysia crispata TaxID=231223 RepID=A0AAE1DM98_9GAST|nr:hypothetical protein RRG08_041542 [Elysia crispata]
MKSELHLRRMSLSLRTATLHMSATDITVIVRSPEPELQLALTQCVNIFLSVSLDSLSFGGQNKTCSRVNSVTCTDKPQTL